MIGPGSDKNQTVKSQRSFQKIKDNFTFSTILQKLTHICQYIWSRSRADGRAGRSRSRVVTWVLENRPHHSHIHHHVEFRVHHILPLLSCCQHSKMVQHQQQRQSHFLMTKRALDQHDWQECAIVSANSIRDWRLLISQVPSLVQ